MPISNTSKAQQKQGRKDKLKRKYLMPILISLMLLAGLTAGAYFYFNKPAGAATETKKSAIRTADTESMDMSEVLVNLNGGHYLRVKIILEYPRDKRLSEEIKKKKTQLLDVIITTLRSKTLDEVGPVGSVEEVKKNLLDEINQNLDNGEVASIYFTDYLVQ